MFISVPVVAKELFEVLGNTERISGNDVFFLRILVFSRTVSRHFLKVARSEEGRYLILAVV
jgi:hypothetical protein